jgi:hypothetical protein
VSSWIYHKKMERFVETSDTLEQNQKIMVHDEKSSKPTTSENKRYNE